MYINFYSQENQHCEMIKCTHSEAGLPGFGAGFKHTLANHLASMYFSVFCKTGAI